MSSFQIPADGVLRHQVVYLNEHRQFLYRTISYVTPNTPLLGSTMIDGKFYTVKLVTIIDGVGRWQLMDKGD